MPILTISADYRQDALFDFETLANVAHQKGKVFKLLMLKSLGEFVIPLRKHDE